MKDKVTAIRGIVTGVVGALVAFNIIPVEDMPLIAENAGEALGAVLALWSYFIARRVKEQKQAKKEAE